jgi:LysR family transcriptional regulator, flagellar master operon regulator
MDIELAQTFVQIVNSGTFARAASRLHVTQAAVSARVRALEGELGQSLFIRNKAGARMTAAGREFLPLAMQLVHVWQEAKRKAGKRTGREALLNLGSEFSLWSGLLLSWLITLRRDRRGVALRAHMDNAERLLDRVQTGVLDIAVMYTPYHRPGIEISPLFEEELIAVTTAKKPRALSADDYVYVDWGPDFAAHHDAAFPGLRDVGLHVEHGPLALRYILAVGGTGYFRTRAVRPYLDSGRLSRAKKAPAFSYSAYAAHSTQSDPALVQWALSGLIEAAKQSTVLSGDVPSDASSLEP